MGVELVTTRRGEEEFVAAGPRATETARHLDRAAEPFWAHADRALFLLRDAGRVVGRVAAVANAAHDRTHGDGAGFFAWLETPAAPGAARLLLGAAEAWLRDRGYASVR